MTQILGIALVIAFLWGLVATVGLIWVGLS